jgi:hypothetical protein
LNVHATFQRNPCGERSIEFLTLVMAIDQQRFYAIARGSAMEAAAVLDTSG